MENRSLIPFPMCETHPIFAAEKQCQHNEISLKCNSFGGINAHQTLKLCGVQHLQQAHAQTQAAATAAAASVALTAATAPAGVNVPTVVQPPTESTDVHSWMSMPHASMVQVRDHMKDKMPLDSCSSVDPFCNPNLVCNETKIEKTLNLACNAGVLKTDHQAKVPGCGSVWFDDSAIANVFSLAKMVKKHRVQFDSAVESAFVMHGPKGVDKIHTRSDVPCMDPHLVWD